MGIGIAWLIAKGVPTRFARPVAYAALALLLLAALGTALCAIRKDAIDDYSANQAAANAKADRKADAKVAEQRRVDDARITQESTQLEKVQANATSDTARRLARHRCLRLQQQARAEHKPPPGC